MSDVKPHRRPTGLVHAMKGSLKGACAACNAEPGRPCKDAAGKILRQVHSVRLKASP